MENEREFEDLGGERIHDGEIVDVDRERFRFRADAETVERDVVRHPGGVAIVAHDGANVLLVRQPRPAVGEPDLLEIPAGRLDRRDEEPLEAARRELAEEIGRSGERWTALGSFYPSPDVLDAEVHLFLAEELRPAEGDSGEDERIEPVAWPLGRLDDAIAATRDAKTLIGLLMLARRC